MKKIALLAALLAPALACAQSTKVGPGIQVKPRSSAPTTGLISGNGIAWSDSSDSNVYKWRNPAGTNFSLSLFPSSLSYAKGTLLAHSGAAFGALAVGTNGQCLTAQSGQTLGLLWASCGAGGGGTLASDYAAGSSSSDSRLDLDSTRRGLFIRDNATPIVSPLFRVEVAGGAAAYFEVDKANNRVRTGLSLDPTADESYSLGGPGARFYDATFGSAVGTGQTAGLTLLNSTAATSGNQKYSPMLVLDGRGWKTDATAASQSVSWGLQTRPVQGSANPRGDLVLWSSVNGGSYAEALSLEYGGITSTSMVLRGQSTNYLAMLDANNDGVKVLSSIVTVRAGGGDFVTFNASNGSTAPAADLGASSGDSSHRWLKSWQRSAVVGDTSANKPTCDATSRGSLYVTQATAGNADTLEWCGKKTDNTYAWKTADTQP